MQNLFFFKSLNKNLTVLPMFCLNDIHFKYHDPTIHNSFFVYFKYKEILSIENKKIYFCHTTFLNTLPFFNGTIPPIKDPTNKMYISFFSNYFYPNLDFQMINNIFDSYKYGDKKIVGIHLRSYFQKLWHHQEYLSIPLNTRLSNLKIELDQEFGNNYVIFVATDVSDYIDEAKKIFDDVKYLDWISRIKNNKIDDIPEDSIPNLGEHTGIKLGTDILYDCYMLSRCDKIYLTKSNITIMVSLFNPEGNMIEF
jgi:hypothetical protein